MNPIRWDPETQTVYVQTDTGVLSGRIPEIGIRLSPVEAVPEGAVEFHPERRLPMLLSAHAIMGAIRRAEDAYQREAVQ